MKPKHKLLILVVMAVFLMVATNVIAQEANPISSYKEALGDESLQRDTFAIIHRIIEDGEFLYKTKPSSAEELHEQILALRYRSDTPSDEYVWKLPSKTYIEGGDCEDLTTFVIARAVTMGKTAGFIEMSPEVITKDTLLHIAAAFQTDSGRILIIDATIQSAKSKILYLDKYFETADLRKYTRYRIWWLFETNSEQEGIKRIPQ
jgi:hypothetical protein